MHVIKRSRTSSGSDIKKKKKNYEAHKKKNLSKKQTI